MTCVNCQPATEDRHPPETGEAFLGDYRQVQIPILSWRFPAQYSATSECNMTSNRHLAV